jgi:hypothetical protein
MRAVAEIPAMMLVAWVWGIAIVFWLLDKLGRFPPRETNEPAVKFIVKLLGFATLGCLGLLLAVPGWLAGIPPEGHWLYYSAQGMAIVLSIVTGILLYPSVRGSRVWVAVSALTHTLLCISILIVPLWETHRSAGAVYQALTVVDDIPPGCHANRDNLFAVLSDVHLVASNVPHTNDGGTPGNALIADRLTFAKTFAPRYLFITGDLTDTGSVAEWEMAWRLLEETSETTRIIVAPGNHDQNAAFSPSRKLSVDEAQRLEAMSVFDSKMAAYFRFQARLVPELVSSSSGQSVAELRAKAPPMVAPRDWVAASAFFDEKVRICMRNSADDNLMRARVTCARGVRKFFPNEIKPITLVEEADEYWAERKRDSFPLMLFDSEKSAAIFVLASDLSEGESIGANAIGYIDERQLNSLRTLLRSISPSTQNLIFLLHHPLTRPRNDTFSLPPIKSMTMRSLTDSQWWTYAFLRTNVESAKRVLAAINEELARFPEGRGYVMFGHRHKRSFGTLDRLTFVESPNVSAPFEDRGSYVGSVSGNRLNISWCRE